MPTLSGSSTGGGITGRGITGEYYKLRLFTLVVVVDGTTLKMARKPVKLQKENALGKVDRVKEIRRREMKGLKMTDNSIK